MNLGEIGSRIKKTHIRASNKHDDITVESSTTFKSFRRVKSAAIRLEDSKWGKGFIIGSFFRKNTDIKNIQVQY